MENSNKILYGLNIDHERINWQNIYLNYWIFLPKKCPNCNTVFHGAIRSTGLYGSGLKCLKISSTGYIDIRLNSNFFFFKVTIFIIIIELNLYTYILLLF